MNMSALMTVEEKKRLHSPKHEERRAKAAIAEWLRRFLIVPNIYFDAAWQPKRTLDVLAIDRAGSGDVHAVEVKAVYTHNDLVQARKLLLTTPANYTWLALVAEPGVELPVPPLALLNPGGMGRIGLIRIEPGPGESPVASIQYKAERFAGSLYDRADRFTKKHKPDLQTRP